MGTRTILGRAVAAALAAGALLVTAGPAQAVDSDRWWGRDRFATAAAIADAAFPDPVDTVFVVNGLGFADALAAAPAAAHRDAPVLPVLADAVPDATRAELVRLQPATIVVIGGAGAVSDAVAGQLEDYASQRVDRWSGGNRYDTARAVLTAEFAGTTHEVIVASGQGFADALAGGSAGAATSTPLVLTARDGLPPETRVALQLLAPTRITIVGGTAAISSTVEQQLATYAPGAVRRLAGGDRYQTAAEVMLDTWDSAPQTLLASGANFPDALAGAALGTPLLLSRQDCLPKAAADAYAALHVQAVTGLGGTAVLGNAALAGTVCATPAPVPAPAPVSTPTPPASPGDTKNCTDFATWRAAQDWFETYYPSYGDVAKLDADNNRIACEGLPGAPPA